MDADEQSHFVIRPFRLVYEASILGTALYWYGWGAALLVLAVTIDFIKGGDGPAPTE